VYLICHINNQGLITSILAINNKVQKQVFQAVTALTPKRKINDIAYASDIVCSLW